MMNYLYHIHIEKNGI